MLKYKIYGFTNKDGIHEDVVPEKWYWEVQYFDGISIRQYDDGDQTFHQIQEIDLKKPFMFKLKSDSFPYQFSLLFTPDSMIKMFYYYKRFVLNVKMKVDGEKNVNFDYSQKKDIVWYVFGYEKNGEKHFHAILPNNELVVTDDINKLEIK